MNDMLTRAAELGGVTEEEMLLLSCANPKGKLRVKLELAEIAAERGMRGVVIAFRDARDESEAA